MQDDERPATKHIAKRYVIEQQLGTGAMGVVYQVRDRLSSRAVALKLVSHHVDSLDFDSRGESGDPVRLLITEFQTLARLRHPNIIDVYDFGFDHYQRPFFTMQWLQNALPITTYSVTVDLGTKIKLFSHVIQALIYLHRHGILHRDLKPENVLVDANGAVKVLDFGLALNMSVHADVAGTLLYIAPELFMQAKPSIAADLYAAGTIFYIMLTGVHPFFGDLSPPTDKKPFMSDVINQILLQPPDLTPIPPMLRPVVEKLLAKAPNDRFEMAETVYDALSEVYQRITQQNLKVEATVAFSLLRSAPLIGRDAEMQQLRGALKGLQAGQGGMMLVSGESGIGKSRLLDEFRVEALAQGAGVYSGIAVEAAVERFSIWRPIVRGLLLTTDIPATVAGALHSIVPDIEALLERPVAPHSSMGVETAICRLLLAQSVPTVIILDDLQWAAEGIQVLHHLQADLHSAPLLVIAAYRDSEYLPLPDELPDVPVLSLRRLSPVDVAAISAAMIGAASTNPGVNDLLIKEAEGNPFFLIEVVQALAMHAGSLDNIGVMTLPPGVYAHGIESIVARHLSMVQHEFDPFLCIAAIWGRQLDVPLMQRLFGEAHTQQAIVACTLHRVFEAYDHGYRFAHDKLREACQLGIPTEHFADYHQRLAHAVEAHYAANLLPYSEALLGLWIAGDDLQRALTYVMNAVRYHMIVTRRYESALKIAGAGIHLATELDNTAERAANHLLRARIHIQVYRAAEALEDLTVYQSLVSVEALSPMQRFQFLRTMGMVQVQFGAIAVGSNYYDAALEIALAHNMQREIVSIYELRGHAALSVGDTDAALDGYRQSLHYDRDGVNLHAEYANLVSIGRVYWLRDEPDMARMYLTFTATCAFRTGHLIDGLTAQLLLGHVLLYTGDVEAASQLAYRNMPRAVETGQHLLIAESRLLLGEVELYRENIDSALEHTHRCQAMLPSVADQSIHLMVFIVLARLAILAGQPQLHDYMHQILKLAHTHKHPLRQVAVLQTAARWAFFVGEPENALRWGAYFLRFQRGAYRKDVATLREALVGAVGADAVNDAIRTSERHAFDVLLQEVADRLAAYMVSVAE